ncbi:MAG: phenylalanine--tRNA ligase subunit beta [Rhodospirillales bacterium]|jgi:phenylalanyl-tRNA synthetase beta chain|nr:phenylalanine--tRNA ligase subunit beta [Rhodospirillales bacterium]MDP6803999.1 phenylalanine--tRNA ligase subunit beta [Rhodospirillales bacterium]
MKFSLSWLGDHLETEAGVDEIATRLTMLGLEVDSVETRAQGLEDFTVARVIEARKHPNADRLKLCLLETKDGEAEVVCGAPNARAGLKGVFAAPGSFIPGLGAKLKRAKIRGVESAGMLLSELEMGLGEEHGGIVELPADAPIGAPVVDVMGLDDPVFDLEITPNRGDCLGVRGIARDLAAAGLGTLKPLVIEAVPGAYESPIGVHLEFDPADSQACPHFVGRHIRGLVNRESPDWLKDRLLAVGLRPISALVDITNFLTLGYGRPLHAFDADRVAGDLRVRLAKSGERFEALGGRTYELDGEMTVICDDHGADALGGIMGGERTGCTDATTNVFLESAFFDPVRTAATGRKLNLTSDARYRFERGIDPAFQVNGVELATRLVLELCGGEPSALVIAGGAPDSGREIAFAPERVATLGGIDVPVAEAERILTALGFVVGAADGALAVTVPSWRNDIVGEACLVEEVVRVFGYDRVPAVPVRCASALPEPALSPDQARRATARRALAAQGLIEAVTLSFTSSKHAEMFASVPESLRLVNPISAELDVMRPSILPNLIAAFVRNANRGFPDAALFEVGPQYAGARPADQATVAAGIRAGSAHARSWARPPRGVDAFDAKDDALAVFAAVGIATSRVRIEAKAPDYYHPGRSGVLRLEGGEAAPVLATFGEIHPAVLSAMDARGPAAGFEVYLDSLPGSADRAASAPPELSPFQPVARDFAFVVDADVAAAAVLAAVRGAEASLIAEVQLFDVFSGGGLGAGKKSLAVGVVLQPKDRTLTDTEIETVAEKIIARVGKKTGGVLRT